MAKITFLFITPLLFCTALTAQLTPDQRAFDFQQISALFAKQYGAYEWKRDMLKADIYDISPWMAKVRAAKSDPEFWEVCARYVASLKDSHTAYYVQSSYELYSGISVDIYDGKVLIESVSRSELPLPDYPFLKGDEVVSIDGKAVNDWIADTVQLIGIGTPRAARRIAASFLFDRPQQVFPRVIEMGKTYKVGIRLAATGELREFEIPWRKYGTPLTSAGVLPNPFANARAGRNPELAVERYLDRFDTRRAAWSTRMLGLNSDYPVFTMPGDFVERTRAYYHYSGTYSSDGKRIGFLRIPTFSPSSSTSALKEFDTEIAYMNENTDGLVIDITRNTGGGCYAADALRRLIPQPYQVPGSEIRATLSELYDADYALYQAKQTQNPASSTIAQLQAVYDAIRLAMDQNRGRTAPLPFCGYTLDRQPAIDSTGKVTAYNKPLILLVDEMTASWGDVFAATIQDNNRGPLFGTTTNGAGGNSLSVYTGYYSESSLTYSDQMCVRTTAIQAGDFGLTGYIENVGVRPNIVFDYMTRDNLMQSGKPFVDAFTAAIVAEIGRAK